MNFHSLFNPNHLSVLSLDCWLNDFSPLYETPVHWKGSTGADFAKFSACLTNPSIIFSIGHHPVVRESLIKNRIRKIVNKYIIIVLKKFCAFPQTLPMTSFPRISF